MSARSKRYKSNLEKFDLEKTYLLDEGIDLIKETSNIKFDETIDISINLSVDPTFSEQNVRGVVITSSSFLRFNDKRLKCRAAEQELTAIE